MAKPKKGQQVTHKSGQKGKVVGSTSSTTWVQFHGSAKPTEVYSSSVHKSGGPCLIWALGFIMIPVVLAAGGVYFA